MEMDKYSTPSYVTNFVGILFGVITLQELGVIVGIILGVATFITNLYFKRKQEKRAQEEHLARMHERGIEIDNG